mgnify:CR=1 FL=1
MDLAFGRREQAEIDVHGLVGLGFGIAGALTLAVGVALLLLGLLRLVQTEWERAASGSLSWLAYLIVLVVCVLAIVLALSRIDKGTLNRDPVDPNPRARKENP